MIRKELSIFFSALMFYTIIPCPARLDYSHENFNKATRYFPLIGLLVGVIAAGVFWVSFWVFSKSIALILSMAVSIWITGAFHEDGLADVFDGMGGGWEKNQVLTIMKDSRIGVFGVIGLIMVLGIKFLVLHDLLAWLIPLVLITGHTISRFVTTIMIFSQTYVQDTGASKAKPVAIHLRNKDMIIAGCFGLIALLLWGNFWFLFLVIPAFITQWLLGKYFKKRIGGYTGDCLGATQQITEIIIYLEIAADPWKFI